MTQNICSIAHFQSLKRRMMSAVLSRQAHRRGSQIFAVERHLLSDFPAANISYGKLKHHV